MIAGGRGAWRRVGVMERRSSSAGGGDGEGRVESVQERQVARDRSFRKGESESNERNLFSLHFFELSGAERCNTT